MSFISAWLVAYTTRDGLVEKPPLYLKMHSQLVYEGLLSVVHITTHRCMCHITMHLSWMDV
jgi:hypothetical protein